MNLRKKRKPIQESEQFDITSLLDILVILLVFLLKNFTDSDLTVDLAQELALPYAFQRGIAHQGAIVQVNAKEMIYYDKKLMGSLRSERTMDQLKKSLLSRANEIEEKREKKNEPKLINLVFDKALKYESIDKILNLSAESGFSKYKLIVQGDE